MKDALLEYRLGVEPCPPDFVKMEGICYKVKASEEVMFSEADSTCKTLAGGKARLYEPRDFRCTI